MILKLIQYSAKKTVYTSMKVFYVWCTRPLQLLSMQCRVFCLLERGVEWSSLRIRLKVCSKLTILHPLATNVLKSGPLRGHVNSGFNFMPVMFGQNDTLSDSITWQCLLILERPESVKVHPLKSKDVKVRPTAKQICGRSALTSIGNFLDMYNAWYNCVGCWNTGKLFLIFLEFKKNYYMSLDKNTSSFRPFFVELRGSVAVSVLNNTLVVPDHWTNC